ncbi:hypothetical protein, partial [Dokdonella sp.]|uniref:hypothetical protein n=1 Tax=Dokdonella sp. TaxID=2291710 RepID=UPI002622E5D6
MRRTLSSTLAVAAAVLSAATVSSSAATWPLPDPAYGGSGDGIAHVLPALVPAETGFGRRAIVQADGRLVMVGTALSNGDPHDERQIVLMRLDAAGQLDASFGPEHDGLVRTVLSGEASDIAQTADGKLLYLGKTPQYYGEQN